MSSSDVHFTASLIGRDKPFDTVTLAKDTPFQIDVSRYTNDYYRGNEAVFFSALVEELLQLKKRVEELEGKAQREE